VIKIATSFPFTPCKNVPDVEVGQAMFRALELLGQNNMRFRQVAPDQQDLSLILYMGHWWIFVFLFHLQPDAQDVV